MSKKKIFVGIAALLVLIGIGAGTFWFSMSSEARNMITWFVLPGESYENYQEYQVVGVNSEGLAPSAFDPVVADSEEGDQNTNILVITEMVKNEDSKMMKKGNVQTAGVDDYNGWYLIADEGAAEGSYPFGPSPLSYYTSGLAANLHTQIIKAAEVKGVELDSVKVEVLNEFRWDDMLSAEGAGFLDLSTTNIIIESSLSKGAIQEITEMALNAWAAGEALRNETVIEPTLVVNGDYWETYRSVPGTTDSVDSFTEDIQLTRVTDVPRLPEYVELTVEEDAGFSLDFDSMSNLHFEIFAIAESAENSERPYLSRITLSTPSSETWEIYADEFMGDNDIPIAPTSLEYFTAGTSLCLTSQMTLVSATMDLDLTEYRAEHQIDYRQEDVNSAEMAGYTDVAHSFVVIESDESQERLDTFYNKALSLCFAGEGLKNVTDMDISIYLNGNEIK